MFEIGDEIVAELLILSNEVLHPFTRGDGPLPVDPEPSFQEFCYSSLKDLPTPGHRVPERVSRSRIHLTITPE